VSPIDRDKLEEISTGKLARLAREHGADPAELFAGAVKRIRADKKTAAKRLCTVSVLCSQLEQWVVDAPEPDAPKRKGGPAPVSTPEEWEAMEAGNG
jgi:hypothetical protein